MPTLTSELVARLKDHISAPAAKAGAALERLKRRAGTAGSSDFFGRMNARASETARSMLAFGGAAGAAAFAAKSYRDFAQFDRQMTRIGITADASAQEVAQAKKQVRDIANQYGLETAETVRGLDSLTAAGRNMKDALAFLPSVSATAQASGADVADMASSADALGSNLKVNAGEMQQAFDILAAAGKAGKFELKDMARYLPSLAAGANAVGLKGLDGTKRVAAMLQVIRTQTGTAEEAATALQNVFQKMQSDATVKKFGKMGVNLEAGLAKAKKQGKDVLEVFLDLSEQALKGDLSKIPQLFNDMQTAQGMRALISQRQMLRELQGQLGNVAGTVQKDLAKVQADAMSGLTKLENAVGATANAMGNAMHKGGVTTFLTELTTELDKAATAIETLSKNMEKGPLGFMDAVHEMNEQAADDPKAKGWLAGKGEPFKAKTKALIDERKLGRPNTTEYNAAVEEARFSREAMADIDDGGGPASDAQRVDYAGYKKRMETANAFIAAENAKWQARLKDLDAQIADREAQTFQSEHPDFKAPARPFSPTPTPESRARQAVPLPVARPTEIGGTPPPPVAPQVDASQVSAATKQVDDLHAKITETNGISATVNVNPGGMPGVISDLQRIISMIDRINNSSVRMPSGSSGGGSYSDEGVH